MTNHRKNRCPRCADAYLVEPGKKNKTRLCNLCTTELERRHGSTLVNVYMGVMSDGKLIPQTWPNPELDFKKAMEALDRAELLRQHGHTAYAVLVREMTRKSMAEFRSTQKLNS